MKINLKKWKEYVGSPELAAMVGYLTGDGHLQIKDWRYLTSFYANDLSLIKKIDDMFSKLFGIRGKIYIKYGKNIQYRIFFISKPLAFFLKSIGVFVGNKTNNAHFVPSWIIEGTERVKSAYLKAMYECEGCIYSTRRRNGKNRWRITIEQWKIMNLIKEGKIFMEQLKNMLNGLGIFSSPLRTGRKNLRKDGTKSIALIFDIEKKYFSNFYKYVGFDNPVKEDKLLKAIAEEK